MATHSRIPSSQNRHDLSTTYRLTQYFFIFLYVILAEVSARQVPYIFKKLDLFLTSDFFYDLDVRILAQVTRVLPLPEPRDRASRHRRPTCHRRDPPT